MAEQQSASLRLNIAAYDSSEFVLETANNETGYKNVIKVKERYQARLYDKVKQTQRHLPGLFDTAEEAAKYRALVMRDQLVPPTTKPRAPRGSKGDANATLPPASPALSRVPARVVRSQGPTWCAQEAAARAARRRQQSCAGRELLAAEGTQSRGARPGGRHGPPHGRHSGEGVCPGRACKPAGHVCSVGGCCVRWTALVACLWRVGWIRTPVARQ